MLKQSIITPRLTEKALMLATDGIYTFNIPLNMNSNQVKETVESTFKVKVVDIKIVKQDGKAKRAVKSKRAYPGVRYDKDSKKAYVRLAKGESIPVFDQPEDTTEETK